MKGVNLEVGFLRDGQTGTHAVDDMDRREVADLVKEWLSNTTGGAAIFVGDGGQSWEYLWSEITSVKVVG